MNYIRGAVNAISAPYQYYKDLPPINPATLTGAIDVIVIQRPTDSGDSELVCSPFHVRFGKWQVLRPGEKKVNVSVNGHLIPYNMKIGEAGEAFFVFETDEDIPEDLITSPLLQPTRPEEAGPGEEPVPAALPELEGKEEVQPAVPVKGEEELRPPEPAIQEPEFLDLNAQPGDEASKNANITPKQTYNIPAFVQKPSHITVDQPPQGLPSPPPTPTRRPVTYTPEMLAQDLRVDEAFKAAREAVHIPEVEYHHDIALDIEGYHSHSRERSDRTVRSAGDESFPSDRKPRSATPSPVRGLGLSHAPCTQDKETSTLAFPPHRATSEPPPHVEELPQPPNLRMTSSHDQTSAPSSSRLAALSPVQEYSWEWGAFPQPSPVKTSFGKGGRIEGSLGRSWKKGKGKEKARLDLSALAEATTGIKEEGREKDEHGRSRSVPPELDGSPSRDRRGRELVGDHDVYNEPEEEGEMGEVDEEEEEEEEEGETLGFGKGGKLSTSKTDPSRFILHIEGRKIPFELSRVSFADGNIAAVEDVGAVSEPEPEAGEHEGEPRGRRNRYGGLGAGVVFGGRDEVEAARIFDKGKIDIHRFLDDEDLVNDPGLVIRWGGDQYITRSDGSPLMQALVMWRDAALRQRASGTSRPTSPLSEDERESVRSESPPPPPSEDQTQERYHYRSKSEPPEKPPGTGKPTSSSWVQWWSRSGRKDKRANGDVEKGPAEPSVGPTITKSERPSLRGTASAPLGNGGSALVAEAEAFAMKRAAREIPPAESAPAGPSTPVQEPVKDVVPALPAPTRKFAKTLRLTSDQLKALNLKPGANTITFSLSTSGVIACTARIFVWDSTDFVVVSDIDGTITKSDGLGHVFAMIGRDWTHLGVAKLYTDITRNGYKIMYLTSRAIGQADATRDYLKGIKQNDYQLPEGPVIMSPDRLMASLHREVIMRKPEVFKMACLRDIQRLFGEASRNPFYAGFGNRITDALSYRSVNVPSARIFTIDSSGEVKMELLELAGYKSSYIHMTDLVDQMFPPIHRKWAPEFTDFNYWKVPVQDFPLPDLSPPSPALSARSDTSNQSTLARLRNFSLVGSRQNTMRMTSPPPQPQLQPTEESDQERRTLHLRQISSFERLSTTLSFLQTTPVVNGNGRSVSPESSSASYDDSDEDEDEDGAEKGAIGGKRRRRERRRSMTSMPGTLDERHFEMEEEAEEHYGDEETEDGEEEEEEEVEEEAGDEAFDEDLLAAGEMKNVPFL